MPGVHVVPLGQSACDEQTWISPAWHAVAVVPPPVPSHTMAVPSEYFGYGQVPVDPVHVNPEVHLAPFRQQAVAPVFPFAVQSDTWLQAIAIGCSFVPASAPPPFVHVVPYVAHSCGAKLPPPMLPPRQHSWPTGQSRAAPASSEGYPQKIEPASFSWLLGLVPQSAAPPPLLLPLLEPLEPPLEPPLLLPLLEPLELPLLLLPLLEPLPLLLEPLLLLQATAPTPPTATAAAVPKTKARVPMFIASTPFVCFAAPESSQEAVTHPQEHGAHTKGAEGMVATSRARFFRLR